MIKTLEKLKSLNKEKRKVPKSVQDTIPVDTVYEDGIFRIGHKFTKTYRFTDINFSVATEQDKETMMLKYGELLNSFDSSITVKITINNRKIDKKQLENDMLIPLKEDKLDEVRIVHNDLLVSKIRESDDIRQEKYITITAYKNNIEEARNLFRNITSDLNIKFGNLGSKLIELKANERLKIFHDFYRNGHEEEYTFDFGSDAKRGHSFKDRICPHKPVYKDNYFIFGEKYGRVMYLKGFPSYLDPKFVNKLCSHNKNLMFSTDIINIPVDESIREVMNKQLGVATDMSKWQASQNRNNNWSAVIPLEMENKRKECNIIYEDITTRDQRMKLCTFTLVHLADSKEELDRDTESLQTIGRGDNVEFETLYFASRQLLGVTQALPFGLNRLEIYRTLLTESLATFIPFRAQEISDEKGIWYGQNAVTNTPIMINKEKLQNPNTWVLGIPGSGKSFLTKEIIEFTACSTDDDIIIVDPEGEYDEIIKYFDGQIIEIGASSNDHINAMDMSEGYGESGNSIADKSQFIMSLFEELESSRKGSISSIDRSIIDRCVALVYKDSYEQGTTPTLKDLYQKLLIQPETEAKSLAIKLELFTNGSLNIFAHETNVDIHNRIISFNIFNLGKQLKSLCLLVITDALINRVNENWKNGKRTHVFIDEVHVVFENEESAVFFASAWRQFRKRDAYPTGITQNVKYLLDSSQGTSMLSNSSLTIMLNQSASDREELARLLDINSEQMNYITDVSAGHGLIKCGGTIVPFVNEMPDNWLHRLNSTKPSDRKEYLEQQRRLNAN